MNRRERESLVFLLLVGLLFIWAAWNATTFPTKARVFPQAVACAAIVLVFVELGRMLIVRRRAKLTQDADREQDQARDERLTFIDQFVRGLPYLLWIGGFYLLIYLAGFLTASSLFVFLFLIFVGKMRWYAAGGVAMSLLVTLLFLGRVISLAWPSGVIENWLRYVML